MTDSGSRKRSHPESEPLPVRIKQEPVEDEWRPCPIGATTARGRVLCGYCKKKLATMCCMEEACVIHAQNKWKMTILLVCPDCDNRLHDNPVMSDHLRTPLLIKGVTVSIEPSDGDEVTSEAGDLTGDSHDTLVCVDTLVGSDASSLPVHDLSSALCSVKSIGHKEGLCVTFPPQEPTRQVMSIKASRLPLSLNHFSVIHERYKRVLDYYLRHTCSLSEMFRATNVPRQTLMDALGIAELNVLDPERYMELMENVHGFSAKVSEIEKQCRQIIKESYKDLAYSLRGTKLVPFKINLYD